MPLPAGLQSVTVHLPSGIRGDGTPRRGSILFEPEPAVITAATAGALIAGPVVVHYDGTTPAPITLLAVDSTGIQPTGWTYRVTEHWHDAPGRSYPLALPAATPVVYLAAITPTAPAAGEYTVVTGPRGPQGEQGIQGQQGAQGVQGERGPAGADGWGTQASYDALAARVSAVEAGFTSVNAYITDALNRIASLESRVTALENP
ncbi:hypothetical protein OG196_16315 [Kitasatospora purpeofusca]|uniref:hypothetical protein n=1 Tax=Kitasatospora purpeofusca TaxID=67352 RepID=UPI002E152917|nr:hypothetical protein OG196_16315 [Kitasatospora purpeofusca]